MHLQFEPLLFVPNKSGYCATYSWPSSETQGQLEAGKSLNGRKKKSCEEKSRIGRRRALLRVLDNGFSPPEFFFSQVGDERDPAGRKAVSRAEKGPLCTSALGGRDKERAGLYFPFPGPARRPPLSRSFLE